MKKIFLVLTLAICAGVTEAQEAPQSALFLQFQQYDSLLFERGFNHCDLSSYDSLVAEDLEFYHDLAGITRGKTAFITSVKNNICGSPNKIKRELVPGSLTVYPLFKKGTLYGVLQEGAHTFHVFEQQQWQKVGVARFSHLWLMENNAWKLKRVVSYHHKAAH
ncbi:nuclear transport factor 2 family protein [Niabella pedocola]|uniref:Nuclear transport factor 2 family protein n=1 Tax=Niabella pedocola TaxID=1752077 RepID=A0ABS8PTW0_9BACT|nr:nuclear transport factor 2 family protein [Niabella pedocola]MCD2424509.1 nuclear transport factor 2 family protein [Niabella pedocola]